MKISKPLNIEKWIISLGIVFTSMVWSRYLFSQTYIYRYISWAIVTLLLYIVFIARGQLSIEVLKRNLFYAFGYLIIMTAISYAKAMNFGEWFFDLSTVILSALYLCAVVNSISDIRQIAKPLILLTFFMAVYGLWKLKLGTFLVGPVGNMGNRPLYAQYMLLMLPFCLSVTDNWRKWGYIAAALIVVVVIISNVRSAILALIVSSFVTSAIFNRKAFCVITLILIICIYAVLYNESLFNRIGNTSSMQSRFYTWRQTFKMTWDNFMVGGGNWKLAILPYSEGFLEKEVGEKRFFLEPHNGYIEKLSEISIFGLIAYLCVFVCGLYYSIKGRNPYLFMGIIFYMVHIFFDDKQCAPQLMILMTLLGLSLKGYSKNIIKINTVWVPVAISIILLGILHTYHLRKDMQQRFSQSQSARFANNPERAIELLLNIPAFATIENHTMPYIWFLADAYNETGDEATALRLYARAYLLNRNNIYVLSNYANLLSRAGYYGLSLVMYKKILEMKPNHELTKNSIMEIENVIQEIADNQVQASIK